MAPNKKISADADRYLRAFYFNPAKRGSFTGITQFYSAIKADGKYDLSKHMIAKWLRSNDVYTTTRKTTPNFLRPVVVTIAIDETWEIDLADFSQFSSDNDGYKFILMCIDVFSRYLWARPLRTKLADDVVKQLKSILAEGRTPLTIRSDAGHDVHNEVITRDIMTPFNIKQYVTHNELQANYVERVIKTIKSRLWRYFRHTMKTRWVDVLQDIIKSYNNTVHMSLGMKPVDVNKNNEKWVRLDQTLIKHKKDPNYYKKMEPKLVKPRPFKFKLGIHVRIPETRKVTKREYKEKWSAEVFIITDRFHRQGLNVYTLKDLKDRPVGGTFAEPELQRVDYNPEGVFLIDHVVSTKTINGVLYAEVKWYRWPKTFNSYIPYRDLNKYKVMS